MSIEETIAKTLVEKFGLPAGKVRNQRARRIWAEVAAGDFDRLFPEILKEFDLTVLCTITGLDEGDNIAVIYHLAQEKGLMFNLKVSIPKANPVWKTIMQYFPGSTFYERELCDLLGLQVQGLPPGERYPLTDDWPAGQYPLRKDWQPAAAEAKAAKEPQQ